MLTDFIGRTENLQEDFDAVCERIGVRKRALPRKRRATDRDDYRRYYDDATAELVARHFKPDIEAFGYSFG
jgi:hypothetical protein